SEWERREENAQSKASSFLQHEQILHFIENSLEHFQSPFGYYSRQVCQGRQVRIITFLSFAFFALDTPICGCGSNLPSQLDLFRTSCFVVRIQAREILS